MDLTTAEGLGSAFWRVILPVAILVWGMRACHILSEDSGANIAGFRGLSISLGAVSLLLVSSGLSQVLGPTARGSLGLAAAVVGIAGGVVSLRGLAATGDCDSGNRHALLGLIAGVAIAGLGGWALAREFVGTPRPDVLSSRYLAQVARDLNKKVPMRIDSVTQLIRVSSRTGTLIYEIAILNGAAGDEDPGDLFQRTRRRVMYAACTNPDTREGLLNKGIALEYNFSGWKVRAFAFGVTLGDCASVAH